MVNDDFDLSYMVQLGSNSFCLILVCIIHFVSFVTSKREKNNDCRIAWA